MVKSHPGIKILTGSIFLLILLIPLIPPTTGIKPAGTQTTVATPGILTEEARPIGIATINDVKNAPSGSPKPDVHDPEIHVELDQERIEISVQPGSNMRGRFTGTVNIQWPIGSAAQRMTVELIPKAEGLFCTRPPKSIINRGTTSIEFQVFIEAPQQFPHGFVGFGMKAWWRLEPGGNSGESENATAEIYINPYIEVVMQAEENSKNGRVGEWTDFRITLINNGNARDNIDLTIQADSNLEIRGPGRISNIGMEENQTFNLRVKQGSGAGKSYAIEVSADPENYPNFNNASLELFLETEKPMLSLTRISSPTVLIPLSVILSLIIVAVVFLLRRSKKGA